MASNRMDDPNLAGRSTPGVGSKPTTPIPQQGGPPGMVGQPNSPMAHNATSHGAVRYGYSPHGPQMHPNGPYGQMGPQSGHPNMGHGYPHGSYGPNPNHQMHPSQQSQHGGQYGMPMMMPPPSQYPNKPPMSQPPPGVSPQSAPGPHHNMMPSDRSSMSYYGSRFAGPPPQQQQQQQQQAPPQHHGQSTSPHQPNAYYMRPPMSQQQQQGGKNYYPNSGAPGHGPHGYGQGPGGMSSQQQMMMSSQHPHHPQHQMMMHHHQMSQMQQHAGYGPMGDSGLTTATTTSLTHTTASSASSSHGGDNLRHPQPPSIMDEVSQTSTASSQAAEDSCQSTDMPISSSHKAPNKHHMSHPSTPNTSNLGSPGAASLSSYHDDFDSVSSPSWPRTPASPALNSSQYSVESHHHSSSKRSDSIQKLYEMSDEPDRKVFLDKFLQFQEERGCPLTQVPTISKIPLDLYRLYLAVRERGGFSEVTKSKLWKDCAQLCNIANSSSAAYTLRKQYMKHMLHFECKFDRGGIDPGPVILQLDAATTKKKSASSKAAAAAAASNSSTPTTTPRLSPSDSSGQSYHHPMPPSGPHSGYDMEQHGGYPPNATVAPGPHGGPPYHQMPHPQAQFPHHHSEYSPYPPPHSGSGHMPPPPPPGQHPMMPNTSQPSAGPPPPPNHNESVSVKDPFADDDQAPASAPSPASGYPAARQHYPMPPGSQGPYFNQMPPSSQAQSQHHPGSGYPEGHPTHSQPSHYPMESQYPRSSSAAPPPSHPAPESASNAMHSQYPGYPSRMSNGPSSHGYYGGQPPPPQSMPPQQQMSYEQSAHQQGPPPLHHQRSPYESHHAPRPMTPSGHEHYSGHQGQQQPPHSQLSGPMHRFPMPSSSPHSGSSGGFAPRGPYNSSHHAGPSGPPQGVGQQHQQSPGHPHQQQPPPPQPSQPPYNASQESFPKNAETYNAANAPRMQSPLAQRLLAAKESHSTPPQSYPVNQPSMYPNAPSNNNAPAPPTSTASKATPPTMGAHHSASSSYAPVQQQANSNISWMSTSSRYGQPKRHPDFAKPSNESFPSHGLYQQQQQQYGNFPGASHSQKSANVSGQPWSREGGGQFRMTSPSQFMPGHPQYTSSSPQHANNREPWHESRSPSVPPTSSSASSLDSPPIGPSWPQSSRYPSGYSGGPMHEPYSSQHYSQSQQHGMNSNQKMLGFNGRPEQSGPSFHPSMMHPQSGQTPGKLALSSQLAERRGAFAHSAGVPPLYMAAGQQQAMMKRDVIFPPNSVEATVPTPTKHRKVTARDKMAKMPKGSADAWTLFMSLKSGLLAESTYALDVLNVYSNDDSTLLYLGLTNLPGLLEVLLEHYKCYLNEMFDNLFDDTEIGYEARQLRYELDKCGAHRQVKQTEQRGAKKRKLKWYELSRDYDEAEEEANSEDEDEMGLFFQKHFKSQDQQLVLTNTTNYTLVSRNGLPVKFKRSKSLFITDFEKSWDQIKNGFASGYEHWAKGGGETTSHIVTHMEPKENILRLVRVMKPERPGRRSASNGLEDGTECAEEEDDGIELENENDRPEEDFPKIRSSDRARYWKKRHQPEYEEESYDQEESPMGTGRDYQDSIKARVLTISNLIRNLTFVPGNDLEMCKHPGLFLVLSRLILLHHEHAIKKRPKSTLDLAKITSMDESLFNEPNSEDKSTSEPLTERAWFSDALHLLRENTLVTLANLSCQLDLSPFPEQISLNILDGILHWATCPSSYAQDSLPAAHVSLSPKRLAYETLTKLSIYESNVDLILATPPWERMDKLLSNLVQALGRHEEQTMREFSVVLLSNFSSEPLTARAIALIGNSIPLLLAFIEQAEQSALHVAGSQGYQALRENPELMGTTLDMIRRAAATLRNISRVTENRALFVQYEARLLALVMSQILDHSVAAIVADILYESSFVSAKKQLLADKLAKEAEDRASNQGAVADDRAPTGDESNSAEGEKPNQIEQNDTKANNTESAPPAEPQSNPEASSIGPTNTNTTTTANGPKSAIGEAANSPDSIRTLDSAEKVNNEPVNKTALTNSQSNLETSKPRETSNGFEHNPSVNQKHIAPKSESNNQPSRVSNGVLANSHVHKNVKSDVKGKACELSEMKTYAYTNSHGEDFFGINSRKGGLTMPQGSPLLAHEKQPNHANFNPSPYPSTNLTPSARSISSNGLLNSVAGDGHNESPPGSIDPSDNKKAVANELNSVTVSSGAAAAVIEATST